MAAQKGSLFLVKVGDGVGSHETFTTVASARSTGMTVNNESVDITAKDSAGWRELLAGAGIQSMSITLSGVFKDSVQEELIRGYSFANSIDSYQLFSGNGDMFSGEFQVTSYSRAGEHNGEETFDLALESSGVITVTLV